MNVNLLRTINALGFASSLTGWSLDKAMVMARSIGSNVAETFPLVEVLGRRIAVVNAFYASGQLFIGVAEDGFTWDDDGWNLVSASISVAAVFAIGTAAAPWIAVGGGLVTVGIGVYTLVKD